MPPVQLKLNNGSMYSKLGHISIISGVISKCSVESCGVLEKESQGLFCFRTKEVWQIIRTFALNLGINQNLIVLCRI